MKKGKDGIYNRYIKRILDFTISFVAIILLSPLLLILTITGAVAMKGNPFFVQPRPGKIDPKTGHERIFNLIKFRTMTNQKNAAGELLPDCERLNKYGRFLRKTSLAGVILGTKSEKALCHKGLPAFSVALKSQKSVLEDFCKDF